MQLLKLSEISRDTSQFQFRTVEFNQRRLEWLVANWDDAKLDPIDVWLYKGIYYLIGGHHRFEAMLRRKIEECLCRVHHFESVEEAQDFALTSNSNRLEYTDFEYSRGISFLIRRGHSLAEAANKMTLSVGMARKYFGLRHLVGTDWERQCEALDLSSRAYEVGMFCDQMPLNSTELQSLFKVVVDNDLTVPQLKQLLRDLKKQRGKATTEKTDSLFNLEEFSASVVKAVKERNFLDQCAAQSWWLYELIQKEQQHQFPEELKAEFMRSLQKFYAYCVGSDDENIVPTRANGKGRNLRTQIEKKAS